MKIGVLKVGLPLALTLVAWLPPAAAQQISDTPSPFEAAKQRLGLFPLRWSSSWHRVRIGRVTPSCPLFHAL
jgi:hypothetical protein